MLPLGEEVADYHHWSFMSLSRGEVWRILVSNSHVDGKSSTILVLQETDLIQVLCLIQTCEPLVT